MNRISDVVISKRLNAYMKDDNSYYVYALCDGNIPFYIGKGYGDRILQHEEAFRAEMKEIQSLPNDERLKKEEELDAKKARIAQLSGSDRLNRVIIKYGLTESEAYMAESALINALKFFKFDLTNIVNGHASDIEKQSRAYDKTCARTVENYVKECLPDEQNISQLSQADRKSAVFINIGRLYPYCDKGCKNDYWEAARSLWRMDKNKATDVKYMFVTYNQVVKAIFEVEPGDENVKPVLSNDNSYAPRGPERFRDRQREYEILQRIAEMHRSNMSRETIRDTVFNEFSDFFKDKNEVSKLLSKRYFTKQAAQPDAHLEELQEKYMDKVLNGLDYHQRAIRFGIDINPDESSSK